MPLSGKELQQLQNAFLDAFRTDSSLEQMVRVQLNTNLESIAGKTDLTERTFKLLEWADANGKLDELLKGASKHNPGNTVLQHSISEYYKSNSIPGKQELEVILQILPKTKPIGIALLALVATLISLIAISFRASWTGWATIVRKQPEVNSTCPTSTVFDASIKLDDEVVTFRNVVFEMGYAQYPSTSPVHQVVLNDFTMDKYEVYFTRA